MSRTKKVVENEKDENSKMNKKKKVTEDKASSGKKEKKDRKHDNKGNKNKNEDYYEIDKIMAHKKKTNNKGKYEHLIKVKWKGYKKAEWYDEDELRKDVAGELNKYFKEKENLTKKIKKGNQKKEQSKKPPIIMKCSLSHKLSSDFRKTENKWEVSKEKCYGNCGKNYENEVCNIKNPVWVCEGNKNNCYCKVLFCNTCFIKKFLNNDNVGKKRGRSTRQK